MVEYFFMFWSRTLSKYNSNHVWEVAVVNHIKIGHHRLCGFCLCGFTVQVKNSMPTVLHLKNFFMPSEIKMILFYIIIPVSKSTVDDQILSYSERWLNTGF